MQVLFPAASFLAAALVAAWGVPISAQLPAAADSEAGAETGALQQQSEPSQTPPPSTKPPVQAAPPKQAPPDARRQGRTRTSGRISRRLPPPQGARSFEEDRPSRDPGPAKHELMFKSNLMGGYDENVFGGSGIGSGFVPRAMASGSTASLDAALDYSFGNELHSFSAESAGNVRAYPGYLEHPAAGGHAGLRARTTAGRSLTLAASERVGYEPFFNVFSTGSSGVSLPAGAGDVMPAVRLFERRSLNSTTNLSGDLRMGRSDSASASYSYRVERFVNIDYGRNRSHRATAAYRRALAPSVRVGAEYTYSNREYTGLDEAARPMREHRIEAGPDIQKALSRRRSLTLSLSAGAAYVESVSRASDELVSSWVPVGNGSLRLALSPSWFLEGGYRREFLYLRSVTDDVYTTDTVYLNTGGLVTGRTSMRLGATAGNWRTFVTPGLDDTFRIYGASCQLAVGITSKLAVTTSYSYYHHRFSNPGALPAGFPARFNRHSVMVGLSLWLPLAGEVQPAAGPSRIQ